MLESITTSDHVVLLLIKASQLLNVWSNICHDYTKYSRILVVNAEFLIVPSLAAFLPPPLPRSGRGGGVEARGFAARRRGLADLNRGKHRPRGRWRSQFYQGFTLEQRR